MRQTEIPPINKEIKEEITKSCLAEVYLVTYKAYENDVGLATVLEGVRTHLRNAGIAFATNMRKMFNIEGNDIHTIGVVCALGNLFFGLDAKEIDHTNDRIVYFCKDCAWQNAPMGACLMQHTWSQYYIEAINPDYEERVTQMIPKGDPICSWVIEKKKK
jgi:hypothetical protein